jgi:hypothetical protein
LEPEEDVCPDDCVAAEDVVVVVDVVAAVVEAVEAVPQPASSPPVKTSVPARIPSLLYLISMPPVCRKCSAPVSIELLSIE